MCVSVHADVQDISSRYVIILGGSSFCLEQEIQPIKKLVLGFHCVGLRAKDGEFHFFSGLWSVYACVFGRKRRPMTSEPEIKIPITVEKIKPRQKHL